jgi:hypothetical protein
MNNNMNTDYAYMHEGMHIHCILVCHHMEMVEKHVHEVLSEDNMFVSDAGVGVPCQNTTLQDTGT